MTELVREASNWAFQLDVQESKTERPIIPGRACRPRVLDHWQQKEPACGQQRACQWPDYFVSDVCDAMRAGRLCNLVCFRAAWQGQNRYALRN